MVIFNSYVKYVKLPECNFLILEIRRGCKHERWLPDPSIARFVSLSPLLAKGILKLFGDLPKLVRLRDYEIQLRRFQNSRSYSLINLLIIKK